MHLIGSLPAALTPTQVNIAIQQLNADFVAPNPSWGIQFRLAGVAPDGSCTNGITSHSDLYHYSNFKSLTGWPNDRYLNIWVVIQVNGDPGILGAVSVLPTLFAENSTCDGLDRLDRIAGQTPSFDAEDGVVIKLDEFYPNNANRHTLTHEVGHWLNLLHIFQDGPSGACFWSNCHPLAELAINGDLIDDTNPQQQVLTFNPATCSTNAGECTSGVTADLDNFMGYAHPCQTTFTQRQREWMFACLDLNRPLLSSTENLECTGVISTSSDISGNITWDLSNVPTGVMQVTAEIHILSNSSLTVAAGVTVRFCENAKLVVDPGGRLVLNGTLTNACEGKMWAGVEVHG
ncbi:MAG: M43 family zinc metalloprotease, partial [Saprospiraceae bacterium]|nr:M43 family zinc metalloprotease [Saprospiraceae bacterium]